MLYTQQTVKDNIRNRDGKRVFFLGTGDQLTPGARDYLRQERISILPASEARQDRYQLVGGGILFEKPEEMTHLHGNVLVRKTHPRIAFRGKMDQLETELMLCQLTGEGELRIQLGEILQLARHLVRCDVLNEPVDRDTLCGMTQEELHRRSHFPQDYYGQPHFMPEYTDGAVMLQLNRARCAAREAERMAADAFADREGACTRVDILQALNRMSSMLWILMIQRKKENEVRHHG